MRTALGCALLALGASQFALAEPVCPNIGFTCRVEPCDLAARAEKTAMILEWVRRLDSAVPAPSPREQDWLDAEYAAGGKRWLAAERSVEGLKFESRKGIDWLLTELILLSDTQTLGYGLRLEMKSWANVGYWLTWINWVTAVSRAREQRIGDLRPNDLDSEEHDIYLCTAHANTIFSILGFYAAGALPDQQEGSP